QAPDAPIAIETFSALEQESKSAETPAAAVDEDDDAETPTKDTAPPRMSLSLAGNKPKHSNPLMKKNPLAKKRDTPVAVPEKKMSNAERIMREELERKRLAEQRGSGGGGKRQSGKAAHKQEAPPQEQAPDAPIAIETFSALEQESKSAETPAAAVDEDDDAETPTKDTAPPKMSLSLAGNKPKHSNPLMKKNPLAKKRDTPVAVPEKKMSNAERIMKEELERKRLAEQRGSGGGGKRQRLG
ncbi:hypothetical protein B0A55_02590, partial [Friedmanniomyces simplex]